MHTLTLHIELSIDNTLINLPKKQLITETMLIWQMLVHASVWSGLQATSLTPVS